MNRFCPFKVKFVLVQTPITFNNKLLARTKRGRTQDFISFFISSFLIHFVWGPLRVRKDPVLYAFHYHHWCPGRRILLLLPVHEDKVRWILGVHLWANLLGGSCPYHGVMDLTNDQVGDHTSYHGVEEDDREEEGDTQEEEFQDTHASAQLNVEIEAHADPFCLGLYVKQNRIKPSMVVDIRECLRG